MVYLGSKEKISHILCPLIQNIIDFYKIENYCEPFVGGANIIDKIKCSNKYGFDKSRILIALLQQAQKDFSKIPTFCSEEEFKKARSIYKGELDESMEDYILRAYSFLGGFSGRGFKGGYGAIYENRNFYQERYNNLLKQSANFSSIIFDCKSYETINVENFFLYLDPPYQNKQNYQYKFEDNFNYDEFWNWVRKNSKNNYVIVSEENFPNDFDIIKEITKKKNGW